MSRRALEGGCEGGVRGQRRRGEEGEGEQEEGAHAQSSVGSRFNLENQDQNLRKSSVRSDLNPRRGLPFYPINQTNQTAIVLVFKPEIGEAKIVI